MACSKCSPINVGFISLAAPFFDSAYPKKYYGQVVAKLKGLGVAEIVSPEAPVLEMDELDKAIKMFKDVPIDALILQQGTFTPGVMPMKLAQTFEIPTILWALREPSLEKEVPINSLCAVNLMTCTLTTMNRNYMFVYSDPLEDSAYDKITVHIKAINAYYRMKSSKIGLMGGRAPGFFPSLFDELKARKVLGLDIDVIGLTEFYRFIPDESEVTPISQIDPKKYPTMEGGYLTAEEVQTFEKVYKAFKRLAKAYSLDGLTLRDWPELNGDSKLGRGIWPAIGMLMDDGVITGPEGDMPGTITMMIEYYLTGNVPFLTDMVDFDDKKNIITLWHYGAGTSIAKEGTVRFDGTSGREVEFTLKEGPVTLARLAETPNGYKMLIVPAEVLSARRTIRRAGADIRAAVPAGKLLDEIIYNGWAHHVCLVHGDAVDLLVEFCRVAGIEAVVVK